MDMVVMDEGRGKNDFVDSKLGSVVRINSIAIDISNSMKAIQSPSHGHFSIRGFVAGMRKKDWQACFPFESVGNDVDLEGNLPPLLVPEFRWWQCSSCIIPNAETKRTTEKIVVGTKSINTKSNSCENAGGEDNLFIHRRENQDASDVEPPLCRDVKLDNASSGNDGNFSVLPLKRKPKLRSLADILVEERKHTSSKPRTRSKMEETILVPQLQVDVTADVAKAATSPQRKRKFAPGEHRETLLEICPRAAPKRLERLVLDGEKNSRSIESFESQSEGGALMRFDLARTQGMKHKKAKAFETSKKMRLIHRDNEVAQVRDYYHHPNAASSANLQEQSVPMVTDLDKLGGAHSALVDMRPCFRGSLSRKPMEKTYDISMAKTPEVGADDEPLMPPSKGISGNCNIRGKVASDLSVDSMDTERSPNNQESLREHRFIPDLNMEFTEKTDMAERDQFSIFSEKWSLPLDRTLDASPSCSGENIREGTRPGGISELKNKDNNVESSDDIPMEIVELLARNLHERALGNPRYLQGINKSRGYSASDVDEHRDMMNFPIPSRINGLTVSNGNMGVRPNVSTNAPQLNHNQLGTSRPDKKQCRLFSSSTPSQPRKSECSTSTSVMAGPRSGAGVELLWPPPRENVSFHQRIPQNRPIQRSGMSGHSFLDQCHKGRTVFDMKGGEGKKAISDVAKFKEGRGIRSLDPYSNDSIPAMQLLSLMDRRVTSSSSFEVGTNSSLVKPFSPCKHHPRLNGKENHNFIRGSLFPQHNNFNDFSWLSNGVYSSSESLERASSNLRVQVQHELKNPKTTPLDGAYKLEKLPARSNEALGDCTLNRNPADFSIPEVGNSFTISAKELKPRRRNAFKEKSRARNIADGRKMQRMRKNGAWRECSRS